MEYIKNRFFEKASKCVVEYNRLKKEYGDVVIDNVTIGWEYATGKGKSTKDDFAFKHPAMFPEQLANDHIISWSNEGDLVYDPFMGSGTTAKMAILNKRDWIGSEISEEYCKIIERRITN